MTDDDTVLLKQFRSSGQKKNSRKTLILLETEDQVRDCLSWLGGVEGEIQIIALTPFAIYELDKKNVHYKIIENYYNSEELYKLGIDNFKKVEELCKTIDNSISRINEKLKEYHITPALFSFYNLKIIYDTVTIKLFQLNKLIKCEKPDVIIAYEGEKYLFEDVENAPDLFFDNRESIYSQLLSVGSWEVRIVKKYLQKSSGGYAIKDETYSINLSKRLKKWIIMDPLICDFALVFMKDGPLGIFKYLKNISLMAKKTPVILFGAGYNWDDCLDDLHNAGMIPTYRISEDFYYLKKSLKSKSQSLDIVWDNLKHEQEFVNFFKEGNVNFLPILESRILFLIEKLSTTCIYIYEDFSHLLIKKGIKAVISSTFSTLVGHTISHAARNARIPVVTWQHGGYGQTDQPLAFYSELMGSDAHFVFGDGVRKYLEQPAKVVGTRLVTIGSSSLEKKKDYQFESKQSSKKVILYITSVILQNYLNINTYPPFEDNHFWNTQKTIINILGKYTDYNIIVKQHPSNKIKDTPVRSYVEDKGFNNFTFIKREHSVVELVSNVDLIVIDYPFTTLLQSLMTSKPVFVYLGHIYYDDDACSLLGKRAIYSKDLMSFNDKLDEYLTNKIYEADVNNRDFLISYGLSSLEGSPGVRAARALKQAINEFEFNESSNHMRYNY